MVTEDWFKILNSLTDPASIHDKDFTLIRVNQAMADLLKVRPEDLVGKKCHQVMHGNNDPVAGCPHMQTLKTGRSITKKLFEPRLGANLEVSTSPILDNNGNIEATIHILKQIIQPRLTGKSPLQMVDNAGLSSDVVPFSNGDINKQPLSDIIDIKSLQSLMDSLYAVTPVPFAIIDLNGQVLAGTGWQDICTQFHRVNPQTLGNCLESDTILSQGLKRGEIREYKCKNNLWDIVMPLYIGERHAGNIFSGQFFYEDETIDYDFFTAQAAKYGFDRQAYLTALNKVPRWSRAKIKSLMLFYSRLADIIANLSSSNLNLAAAVVEQKKIEKTLKEKQQDLKHAQAVSHTGSWRLDFQNNAILWSEETYRIFGIPQGTPMTYELFLSIVHPEDRQYVDQKWCASLKGVGYDLEHRIVVEGGIKWVHEKAVLELDSQGTLQSGFGTVQDITERKQYEESLKRHAAELEVANRELEAFSYSASHDLRQPLRALDGFSQAVIEDYADKLDETGKDYLNRVRLASQHMSQIIDDMINLSRITRIEMHHEEVDLTEAAQSIFKDIAATQPARHCEFIVARGLLARGDRQLLALALKNLLENSFKFTSRQSQAKIEFGKLAENCRVFFIKDNGAGFDTQYINKLFKPFHRLHKGDEYPGDGIGLAIVQRIIRRHGGQIWAESQPGKGAVFYFTLD